MDVLEFKLHNLDRPLAGTGNVRAGHQVVHTFLHTLLHERIMPWGRASRLDCQGVSKSLDTKVSGRCSVCQ